MNYYRRLCIGLNDKGKLIPANDNISKHGAKLGDSFKDLYLSIYKYSEEQYQEFLKAGSVAGVVDLVTDMLLFDFDSEAPEKAQQDAVTVCHRLIEKGIDEESLRVFFSGNKGFHVQVNLNEDLNVDEFKAITKQIAQDLETYDPVVSNPSRILRAEGSVHKKSGFYKIPLHLSELDTLTIDAIKEKAKKYVPLNLDYKAVPLPESVKQLKKLKEEFKPKVVLMDTKEIDWNRKPKWLSNCVWSIQAGHFGSGESNSALMVLASRYKNQGFDAQDTYYQVKSAAKKRAALLNQEDKPKDEIWNNIIKVVYGNSWDNGQYSCKKKDSWLHNYCESLGSRKCGHSDGESCFIEIEDFAQRFSDFATNIEQNTLKIGVAPVDERVMITTSMLVGLLGAPSAGKTSLLLNFLEQSNKDSIDSVFFSMDMGLPLVYLRLIQKHFGIQKDEVFDMFRNNPGKVESIIRTIKDSYKYTKFSFRTGMTVEGMKEAVMDHQDKTGRKVKLIGVDYLECISGPHSDATANTALIANQLKDIANDLDVAVMLLLQTQKQSGDPSDPLLSMRNVKGSSVIEQACSVILSLSRPGFSPTNPENDRFATVSTVKDRMGSLMSIDCGWHGLTGSIFTLPEEDKALLRDVRSRKAQEKASKDGTGW